MNDYFVKPGDRVTFAKTIGECDIYNFAGISGDLAPHHVNEEYMARSMFGRRIAHGAMLIAFTSKCSTMLIENYGGLEGSETTVSLGYDRIRFLAPVYIGDTVTLTYTVVEVDLVKRQSHADIEIKNQNGELVAVARHILRSVKNTASTEPRARRASPSSAHASGH